ncbi:DUF6597 domain-containing transcriptional factor [Krasilnikovia sp. M28-CT-15]|uniref:DUF6597 domain-containing transcriptional factor n=1 Tax=Krasilnikovia sp. M28-CT-15 TaxID=3373540 RepID=UPI003877580C
MPAILHPRAGDEKFRFRAPAAAPRLRPYVEHYWIVTWDLPEPYEQSVLPYPAVNMTFKAGRCRVAGVPSGRFCEVLSGAGRVFGVRFRPGGFHPFLGGPVSSITDRFVPVEDMFGPALPEAILAAGDDTAVEIMDEFLAARAPERPDADAELAEAIVAHSAADPGLTRVDDLAGAFGMTTRRLQRLFADYVGVGPKWVIRRHRLHEAADRVAAGESLAGLASALGYSDQAHLTRDFRAMIGETPARYAKAQ